MLDSATLFLKTVEDLERRLLERDPYEILLIAGLIRKLFLDDHPLVDRVNSEHRVRKWSSIWWTSSPSGTSEWPTPARQLKPWLTSDLPPLIAVSNANFSRGSMRCS